MKKSKDVTSGENMESEENDELDDVYGSLKGEEDRSLRIISCIPGTKKNEFSQFAVLDVNRNLRDSLHWTTGGKEETKENNNPDVKEQEEKLVNLIVFIVGASGIFSKRVGFVFTHVTVKLTNQIPHSNDCYHWKGLRMLIHCLQTFCLFSDFFDDNQNFFVLTLIKRIC